MAALIASYPARAADLPAPTPYKAPPVMAPVAYNWSGLYFGANGGGVWTRNSETTTDVATGAVITTGTTNTSGFLVGGQIGFNWMFGGNWVGGVEADGDWVSDKNSVLSLDGSNRHDGKLEALGTGRARFGYAANNWLFYATGGVAWSEGQVNSYADLRRRQCCHCRHRRDREQHAGRLDRRRRCGSRHHAQLDGAGGVPLHGL